MLYSLRQSFKPTVYIRYKADFWLFMRLMMLDLKVNAGKLPGLPSAGGTFGSVRSPAGNGSDW